MHRTFAIRTKRFVWPFVVFASFAVFGFGFNSSAEDMKLVTPNISGAWTLYGLIGKGGVVKELDKAEGRPLKFFSNGHWCVTYADPETGLVEHHHGGTYTLKGNEYAESIKYATESRRPLLNNTFHFTINVDADTLTQKGTDNDFNEVWKRVKRDKR